MGWLKEGGLYGRRFATRREAMDEVMDGLNFYSHRRLHSTLGDVSPMTSEQRWTLARQQGRKSTSTPAYGVETTGARSLLTERPASAPARPVILVVTGTACLVRLLPCPFSTRQCSIFIRDGVRFSGGKSGSPAAD